LLIRLSGELPIPADPSRRRRASVERAWGGVLDHAERAASSVGSLQVILMKMVKREIAERPSTLSRRPAVSRLRNFRLRVEPADRTALLQILGLKIVTLVDQMAGQALALLVRAVRPDHRVRMASAFSPTKDAARPSALKVE
jgi:hypothetical protein